MNNEGNVELEIIPEDSENEPFQHQIFYNIEVETDDNYITLNDASNSESDSDSDDSIAETEKWEETKTTEKIYKKYDPKSQEADYYLTLSKPDEKQQRYCCLTCGSQYLSLKNLFKHKKTHKPPHEDPLDLPDIESLSANTCNICSKTFKKECYLHVHLRNAHSRKDLKCKICHKTFSQSSHLRSHLTMHTGERKYACNMCEKKFKQSGHLLNHKRIHSDERKYSCSMCSKSFKQNIHLKSHLKTHTGEKDHLCIICNKQFKQSGHLQMHMRIHTGERKYACTYCKSKFKQSGHLQSHMKIHERLNINNYKARRKRKGKSDDEVSQNDRLLLENDLQKLEGDEEEDEDSYANRLERNRILIEDWRQSEIEKQQLESDEQTSLKDEELNIPDCLAKEDIPDCLVKEDIADCLAKEDIPDCLVKEDIPDCLIKENIPDCLAKEDIPDCLIKEDIPDCLAKEDILDCLAKEDIPDCLAKEECGESSEVIKDAGEQDKTLSHVIILNSRGQEIKRTLKKIKLMRKIR